MQVIRYAGFVEEEVYAAPLGVTTPLFCVDEASANVDSAKDAEIIYEGALGRSARIHRPGYYAIEGEVEYAFDIRTIGWMLKWCLGGYTYSLDLHEIYGTDDNTLPSFVTFLGKDNLNGTDFEHVCLGCGMNNLSLEVADGYTMAKLGMVASTDIANTIMDRLAVEALLPTDYPLVFHEVTATLDIADISAKIKSLKLEIANNIKSESGRSIGSRFPRRMVAGSREVTFSMDLYYESIEFLELMWGSASGPSATGATEAALAFTFDAGTAGSLVLSLPRCILTNVSTPVKGQNLIELSSEGKAFEDAVILAGLSSVNTEILVTLTNDEPNMTIGS